MQVTETCTSEGRGGAMVFDLEPHVDVAEPKSSRPTATLRRDLHPETNLDRRME